MENEIMNNEELNVEEVDLEEDVVVVCEDPDNSDEENPIGLVVALAAVAAVGIGAYFVKRKKLIDKWMIKRLEKKGYAVTTANEVEADEEPVVYEVEAEEIDE